jgi:hypothetical protein
VKNASFHVPLMGDATLTTMRSFLKVGNKMRCGSFLPKSYEDRSIPCCEPHRPQPPTPRTADPSAIDGDNSFKVMLFLSISLNNQNQH